MWSLKRPEWMIPWLGENTTITLWPFVLAPRLPLPEGDEAHEQWHWTSQFFYYLGWWALLFVIRQSWCIFLMPFNPWYIAYVVSRKFRLWAEVHAIRAELSLLLPKDRPDAIEWWAGRLSSREYFFCADKDECREAILKAMQL